MINIIMPTSHNNKFSHARLSPPSTMPLTPGFNFNVFEKSILAIATLIDSSEYNMRNMTDKGYFLRRVNTFIGINDYLLYLNIDRSNPLKPRK